MVDIDTFLFFVLLLSRGDFMSNIRVHKKMNLMSIDMIKENIINVFYGIVEQYNKQDEYKDLVISKQELWELTGFKGKYNSIKIYEILGELTKSSTYVIRENHKISGSMFVTEIIDDKIKIEVPRTFQKYLFYKKDIDLMYKAKHRKKLTIPELEYYDKEVKTKSKFLVLLKKADILGIKGKYNKRLYSLLMQFKKTGFYFTTWKKFKEILEVPKSYTSSHIDQKIFTPVKKELLKVGIEILEIKKIKKGRSIDRVEIRFKCEEDTSTMLSNQGKVKGKELSPKSPFFSKDRGLEREEEKKDVMSEVKRRALIELSKKGKFNLIEPLMGLITDEEVEEFMGGK